MSDGAREQNETSALKTTLELVALLAGFALTTYAALRLFGARPVGTASWFVGSAVAHDLVLFPLYAGVDAAMVAAGRRWPALRTVRGVAWINHLRFPAVISGVLLLVWSPLIFGLPQRFEGITTFSTEPYLDRWLLAAAVLFGASAMLYAGRVWWHERQGQHDRQGQQGGQAPDTSGQAETT